MKKERITHLSLEMIKKRHEEIVSSLENINKRSLQSFNHVIPYENYQEINYIYNQPNLRLCAHLVDDWFVCRDGGDNVNIFRVDIDGIMDVEKPRGYLGTELIHELRNKRGQYTGFVYKVSNDFLVMVSGNEYYVYLWMSGRRVFNMEQPPNMSLFRFVAIYRNGYCVVACESQIHLINMMEKKKNKFVQALIGHSFTNLTFEMGFEATNHRIVMIFSGKVSVLKFNEEGKLSEEYVILNMEKCLSGCLINVDTVAFQTASSIDVYNLKNREITKRIILSHPIYGQSDIKHVGLDSILSIPHAAYINCSSGSVLTLHDFSAIAQFHSNMAFSLPSDIIECGERLLICNNRQRLLTFSTVGRVFHFPPTEFRSTALLVYSDVCIQFFD